MEWIKGILGSLGDPRAEIIYTIKSPDGDLPGGSFYAVGEQAGEWQVVFFWRDGGNRIVSRHAASEAAFEEAERLHAQARAAASTGA